MTTEISRIILIRRTVCVNRQFNHHVNHLVDPNGRPAPSKAVVRDCAFLGGSRMTRQRVLLQPVLSATDTLIAGSEVPEQLDLLRGARTILNELLLNLDTSFYLAIYSEGCGLLSKCMAILGEESQSLPEAMDDRAGPDDLMQGVKRLQLRFSALVVPLANLETPHALELLKDLVSWQERLNLRHLTESGEPGAPSAQRFTKGSMRDYLRERFPCNANLELVRFTLLAGGFSKTTVLIETEEALNGHNSMVVRAEQDLNLLFFGGADVRREYPMIKLMHRQGIPVAEPLWLEDDPDKLGNRFIVSRMAHGHNPGGNLGGEGALSEALIDDFFGVMVRLNSVDVDVSDPLVQASHLSDWMAFETIADCLRFYVTDYMQRLIIDSEIDPTPDIERAMDWLARNVPECDEQPSIVHMDFNWNNLLVKDDRIQAVLDWETSHLGDPAEELVASQPSLWGIMTLDEMVAEYRRRTGKEISQFRLCYAQMIKYVLNSACMTRAENLLASSPSAPIRLAHLAFPYRGHFLTGLNELIERAEAVR